MNFNKTIKINDKIISNNSPTFIIAEAGVNHGGDMTIAKKLIDASGLKVESVILLQEAADKVAEVLS